MNSRMALLKTCSVRILLWRLLRVTGECCTVSAACADAPVTEDIAASVAASVAAYVAAAFVLPCLLITTALVIILLLLLMMFCYCLRYSCQR